MIVIQSKTLSKKLPKIKAFYNHHSGWIACCPKCNPKEYDGTFHPIANSVKENELYVCSKCYPGILGKRMIEIEKGVFIPGVDLSMKEKALQEAIANGDAYEVVFPPFKRDLMRELRKRPSQNANWFPHETLNDIRNENREHGIMK